MERTLALQTTQQCTASCTHCATFSGPKVTVRLGKQAAEDAIRQAAESQFRDVVFTGGEPTLSGPWILESIALARSLGLSVSLVTNAWWAKTKPRAERRIREFKNAGLQEMRISTGTEHQKYVPLETVMICVCSSVEAGLSVALIVEIIKDRTISRASIESREDMQFLRSNYPDASLRVYESPWMPLQFDEVAQYPLYPGGIAANSSNVERRGGCMDVTTTITVNPDGVISACCGIGMRTVPELQLGRISDTSLEDAIETANKSALIRRIRSEGPERMLARAAKQDSSIVWENMYAHKCQACMRVFKDTRVRAAIESMDLHQPI